MGGKNNEIPLSAPLDSGESVLHPQEPKGIILRTGIVLGFDWGTKRIGVATGQGITRTANPLETIACKNGSPDWKRIDALVSTWQPVHLIVGLPLNMDGSRQTVTDLAEEFAMELAIRHPLPTDTIDERLSTRAARELTDDPGKLDALAAKLILESWFESKCA
ncbi:MAG: Holliday junction resolvase RuvX [Candidatus Eutrophobiaceae bacterium]